MGPGLVVMLADTDAGSLITAAQSGAQWGYALLPLQLALIPVLFIVQELTVRLGLVTGKGHGELIMQRYGRGWALLSVSTLAVASLGALVTEFAGVAGVGTLFGLPAWASVGPAVLALLLIAWTGSYRRVERVALILGAFELVFLGVVWAAHPSGEAILRDITSVPWRNPHLLYLAAANVGAVIMPWMVFYQQSAAVDKGLGVQDLRLARWDTAWGALITQLVMAAVLITTAAAFTGRAPQSLESVGQIASGLSRALGPLSGRLLFALGVLGASLLAAVVVSLAAAWGVGEVAGFRRSLEDRPREAPWFYTVYSVALLGSGAVVISGVNLIRLSVAVEVMNALLLPVVLGFLFLLARTSLPPPYRLSGGSAVLVGGVLLITSGFGVFSVVSGLLSP
ncbi:divalent metal cation transporter [Deinococcus sp.]|uniref:NRAMP family divalent metal transporter n=1 Tax=Deinococcus sp. TaxID=47478 RepID=UPI0025EEBB19|nr:divalent metal cation transporter [Deinococcus sp.]